MSIIRLSVLKDTAYAPDANGDITLEPYNRRRRLGRMETLVEPDVARRTSDLRHYLTRAIESRGANLAGPVVVMVHGFLFDPKQVVALDPKDTDNPHGRLYHFSVGDEREEQRHHTSSWPVGLGFDQQDQDGATGLALAFGWHSQPGFATSLISHFQNFYARAYENAGLSAWVLLNVVDIVADLLPGSRISMFCHSLGSRVVVRALALACKHGRSDLIERLGAIVILGGAEYVVEAQLLQRRLTDIGPATLPPFYNFVSRENDVLDKLGENFGPRTFGVSQVIGHNGLEIESRLDHWIDLQIDSAALQHWMEGAGYQVSGDRPDNVWDHWYYYTFRGNMSLYRDILRAPDDWHIPTLRGAGIPDRVSRRWSIFGD